MLFVFFNWTEKNAYLININSISMTPCRSYHLYLIVSYVVRHSEIAIYQSDKKIQFLEALLWETCKAEIKGTCELNLKGKRIFQ